MKKSSAKVPTFSKNVKWTAQKGPLALTCDRRRSKSIVLSEIRKALRKGK